jgi:acyl dehydratase
MPARIVAPDIESLADQVDAEFGPGDWLTVDQARIDAFAEATGDDQWIHTDPERARRESPFGQTVAHGYLTLALAPGLLSKLFKVEKCRQVINYGIDGLRLREPVVTGSKLRLSGKVLDVRRVPGGAARVSFDLRWELQGARRPACKGKAVYIYFP